MGDYLLYLATIVVLSAVMMYSNLLSAASDLNGLQAGSVPLLISIVMVVMLSYINNHTLKRRAREFATYILLGMKRTTIALTFFVETLVLGALGFVLGVALGAVIFSALTTFAFPTLGQSTSFLSLGSLYALRDTLLYFVLIEALSLGLCIRKIRRLQINSLLTEEKQNQTLKGKARPVFWNVIFVCCLAAFLALTEAIVGNHGAVAMMMGMNTILVPVVGGVWSFYKMVFHWAIWLRANRRQTLYEGSRLYLVAQMLSKVSSNIALNTVLSISLLLAVLTFAVGTILPQMSGDIFPKDQASWLSFAEIGLSLVFIAIYFSFLAVRIIVEAKESQYGFKVMAYLGTSKKYRQQLILKEIAIRFILPALLCLLVLAFSALQLNGLLNSLLPYNNALLAAYTLFAGCFVALYLVYFLVTYRLCSGYLLAE